MDGLVEATQRHSLFDISAEILRLHDERETAIDNGDEEAVKELDLELQAYLKEQLPAKVDGIRGYIRSQEVAANIHRIEAQHQLDLAKRAEGNVARIKEFCLQVMQHFDVQKYTGKLHWIRRQENGGVAPLEIAQPELVPEHLKIVTVKMSWPEWKSVTFGEAIAIEPDKIRIRAALERGEGVPGCRLLERGEHVRVDK